MNIDANILLVEDDPGHALLIKRSLRASGFENDIQHFEDGQDILDFLFDHNSMSDMMLSRYIILLDINMPKIDGVEVLKRIKDDETLRSIPVIMLTTADDDDEINRCYELGCDGFITKSSDISDVPKKLGGFLQVGRVTEVHLKQDCSLEHLIHGV